MTKHIFIGLLLLFVFCQSALGQERGAFIEEATGKKYAVLIGVNDYVRLSKLRYAKNDIEALRDELSKTGFEAKNVYALTCGSESKNLPTKENIELVVNGVLQMAQKGDVVMITMSGHGIEVNGEARFCPPDTNPGDLAGTTVSIKDIFKAVEQSKATFKLMIVDACRDNPFPTRSIAGASALHTLADPPSGVVLLQSSRSGQQSYEDQELRRGVFTHYLVEGLRGKAADKEGRVTLMGLTAYTMNETPRHVLHRFRSKQNPYLRGETTNFVLATVPLQPLQSLPATGNEQGPATGGANLLAEEVDRLIGEIEEKMKLKYSVSEGVLVILATNSSRGSSAWIVYSGRKHRSSLPRKNYGVGNSGFIFVSVTPDMVGDYRRGIEYYNRGNLVDAKRCLEGALKKFSAELQNELKRIQGNF